MSSTLVLVIVLLGRPGGLRPMKGFLVFVCSGNKAYHLWQKRKEKKIVLMGTWNE